MAQVRERIQYLQKSIMNTPLQQSLAINRLLKDPAKFVETEISQGRGVLDLLSHCKSLFDAYNTPITQDLLLTVDLMIIVLLLVGVDIEHAYYDNVDHDPNTYYKNLNHLFQVA